MMKPSNSSISPSSPDAHLVEQTIDHVELFKGNFLHAFRDTVRLPNGDTATREFVIHPGAVMIIGLLDDGRLVMERQYRSPVKRVMIEFPAGKLDPGEDSLACAQRELLEETGYRAAEWAYAGMLHPVISYSTEFIDIWFARGLTLGERHLDDGEFLDVFDASLDELLTWSRNGQLTDAKTLTGLLWLQNHLSGAWPLAWRQA